MERDSRVSVIVPTYNRAPLLGRAIESLLAQTRRPDEIIVIDDGSTDNTEEVARPYGDRIRYIRLAKNGGISHARNTGMREATGDYLAFLDSDDTYLPSNIELQKAFMDAHPEIALLTTEFSGMLADGSVNEYHLKNYHGIYKRLGWSYEDVYEEKGTFRLNGTDIDYYTGNVFDRMVVGPLVATNTIMLRREILDEVGYQNEEFRVGEDFEFVARIAKRYRVGFLDVPTYGIHYHEGQISRFLLKPKMRERADLSQMIDGWLGLLRVIRTLALDDARYYAAHKATVDARMAQLHWQIAVLHLRIGDPREARSHLRKAREFDGRTLRYLQGWLLSRAPHALTSFVLRFRK